MRALFSLTVFGAALTFPCAGSPPGNPVQTAPALDRAYFEAVVEPELLHSCAFSNCHGAPQRPLRLFSPAGLRLRAGLPTDGLVPEEHQANFERARLSAAPTAAALSDLLRKPLQEAAGGAGHEGVDAFGKNVYPTKEDARWKALADWVAGAAWDAGAGGGAGGGGGGADDGGTGGGGGGGGVPACLDAGVGYQRVASIITPATCAREAGCHTPQNVRDAGCFLPDSCEAVRASGCARPSVLPCEPARSKLMQYTGPPYGLKAHQGVLLPSHQPALLEWINSGASCDGGGPWP
ncbi:MAG: hypothetical protein IT380_24145 [Myxococcales bacterium]|nr:hypothetical protein [Myxococcales bacterium]